MKFRYSACAVFRIAYFSLHCNKVFRGDDRFMMSGLSVLIAVSAILTRLMIKIIGSKGFMG